MSETSKDDFSGVLDRLDQLAEIPTGVTAIADEALFRDAAAAIRELTTRLDAANGRIKRWQISASCGDPGYEMQGGKLVCKGCGRAAQEIFQQSGERECRTTNASSIETYRDPETLTAALERAKPWLVWSPDSPGPQWQLNEVKAEVEKALSGPSRPRIRPGVMERLQKLERPSEKANDLPQLETNREDE